MVKLYLDVGHGGSDPGAVSNGLQEKDLNLQIGKKINSLLSEYNGITVKMSRTTDKTLSLSDRTNEANSWGADLFLSIHVNAGGGTGFESFIHNSLSNDSNTGSKREVIHSEVMKQLKGIRDRGEKRANFHVLRETRMSAVLTENLFIDHKGDADKLKKQSFINKIAQGHVNGIVKLFNLKKKKTVNKGKLYKVQTGAFSKKDNAEALARKLKKDGYDTYIVYE